MHQNNINVTITVAGRELNLLAKPHTYDVNEKSNGEERYGWYYGAMHVFNVTDKTSAIVRVGEADYLAEIVQKDDGNGGKKNWNMHFGGKQTIDGVDYQVSGNITVNKSQKMTLTGDPKNCQVGINIIPSIKSAKDEKPAKGKGKKKEAAKTSSKPTTQPAPVNGDRDQLLAVLSKLLGGNVILKS